MRRLAVAVLATAMYDAAGIIETRGAEGGHVRGNVRGGVASAAEIQREAYAWLTTPSGRLELWSDLAGLDMATVIDGADAAIEYARRTPRGESIFGDVRNKARMVRRGK